MQDSIDRLKICLSGVAISTATFLSTKMEISLTSVDFLFGKAFKANSISEDRTGFMNIELVWRRKKTFV